MGELNTWCMPVHGLSGMDVCESLFALCLVCLTACMHTACVLTQVTKELHSQRCKDKEEKHEEKTQIPHLQRDNRKREGLVRGEKSQGKINQRGGTKNNSFQC